MATRDTYTTQAWENLPAETTPLSAERLDHIEQGVKAAMDSRALQEIYNDDSMNLLGSSAATACIVHGTNSSAVGTASYAGGYNVTNRGTYSHASGSSTTINGGSNHCIEGYDNTIEGGYSDHVEGELNKAQGCSSTHVEGTSNTAQGVNGLHVEGSGNTSTNGFSHVEGYKNNDYGGTGYQCNHVEGAYNTSTNNSYVHMEGYYNNAYKSQYTHVEGYYNNAGSSSSTGTLSHMHLEGNHNTSYGDSSHIEGMNNKEEEPTSSSSYSANHIEGGDNTIKGRGSYNHVGGWGNTVDSSNQTHVSGMSNTANSCTAGAVFGENNILSGSHQFVTGRYNAQSYNDAFIVGGGRANTVDSDGNTVSNRKNILALDWTGNFKVSGDVTNGAGESLNKLRSDLGTVTSIASGVAIAKVFETKAALDEWLAAEGNKETLRIGQSIYIEETGTPDYWWTGTGLAELETGTVEIESMTYDETMAVLNAESEVE